MQRFFRVILLFALGTPVVNAANDDLQICAAGGYFSGAQDSFMSGMAMHILSKRRVLGTYPCSAIWRDAYKVGASVSKTGKVGSDSQDQVVKQATDFSEKVYSSVAKSMGLQQGR